jgi:hypothetical protein
MPFKRMLDLLKQYLLGFCFSLQEAGDDLGELGNSSFNRGEFLHGIQFYKREKCPARVLIGRAIFIDPIQKQTGYEQEEK